MNKLWDVDMVGVLATEDYVRQKTGKACVFINNQNAVQFSVRLISETPGNFPNRDLFTGFSTNLESYAFEDRTWEPDAVRKEALVNFLEDKLMVFRPQQKTRRDGDDVYQMTEVRLKSKTDAFQESTTFVPVPVFCAGRHARDEAEFVEKLRARRYVGRIEHISTELHDTPAQVLFKDPLGSYTVHGVFDKHLFANGGFSFQFSRLVSVPFREEWEDAAFVIGDIMFLSLDIYNHMSQALDLATQTSASLGAYVPWEEREFVDRSFEEMHPLSVDPGAGVSVGEVGINQDSSDERSEAVFLEYLEQVARERSLVYTPADLINFHTAMKTSNLVILSGMSGTGKSRLVEVYGRALGMDTEQLNIISVRPSWTDDADLIGYVDSIHNVYRPGDSGLIDTLRQAEQHADTLYLICFDEMNLARVEHYFSQFLSVLEMPQSRRELRLYNEELMNRLYNYKEYPNSIAIGPNVMFVGTVNMDESTHHFSDKVLDRANLITLHMLPFTELRQSAERRPDRNVRRKWNTEEYSAFRSNVEGIGLTEEELQCLQDIHDLLQQADASRGIGYRIVRQIDLYLKNRPQSMHLTREDAFDLQIVQRVLTKVRGSEDQLLELLGQWQGSAASGATSGGALIACLDRHASVSHFVQTRKVIRQKGKELKLHGYTV